MDFASISHRSAYTDCYARNEDEIVINLRTGKDVTAVDIIHNDPFANGCMGIKPWSGGPAPMEKTWELKYQNIWSIRLRPEFKREQYYFSITAGTETVLLFEDGFYTPEEAAKPGRLKQYYKFPWLNPADVICPPRWVNETVWYQIMPDRFCRGDQGKKRFPLRSWDHYRKVHGWDYFGGDLKGITEKLEYLRDLGINGIYMTPMFLSNTNHKYNTFDYDAIDPDFGTEEDLIRLVEKAHALGIRVMLDAVFNHSGTEFAPWQDVKAHGPESPYWDWFFVNQWPLPKLPGSTEDGRFYTFAFVDMMPKLNTNNPEVIAYFTKLCKKWVQKWDIDGIRFDVGNEVSHRFLKDLNRELKAVKRDVFLLGEVWHDSLPWLQGDEYDSSMNYPFLQSIHNFWLDGTTSRDLMYAINRCYTMYPEQINEVLFNFLDTHDTMRAVTRCGGRDAFYQQLALLMTMPGSACIYYGTEIALEGGDDPDCRRPMPWNRIEGGKYDRELRLCGDLIALRRKYPEARLGTVSWKHFRQKRLVCYSRTVDGSRKLTVWLNCEDRALKFPAEGQLLFGRKVKDQILCAGGVAVFLSE